MKTCSKCLVEQPIDNFALNRDRRGVQRPYSWCKACVNKKNNESYHRNKERYAEGRKRYRDENKAKIAEGARKHRLKKRYGLTPEQYQEMLTSQEGVCKICKGEFDGSLKIDHDHRCCGEGQACAKCIRGLLCDRCNRGLGFFRDQSDLLRDAAKYLDEYA